MLRSRGRVLGTEKIELRLTYVRSVEEGRIRIVGRYPEALDFHGLEL
jgi:hypothetical protein